MLPVISWAEAEIAENKKAMSRILLKFMKTSVFATEVFRARQERRFESTPRLAHE